ncbi:HSP20-like chaperone [Russula earlei]|uniref:HSP20-like chaperone n=1 Tax=Russula earlei TaxID=71964 RepID=A0ACC0UGM1_9AGAM|nr:HSP20-like chaperone [Russula earlei]
MHKCTRRGCGKEFDDTDNSEEACIYHPGAPVFHEGLKSWSCCNTVNKPVLDFDEFMAIAGCTRGVHSVDRPKAEPSGTSSAPQSRSLTMTESADGKEVYTTTSARARPQRPVEREAATRAAPPVPAKEVEEGDDLEAVVPEGTACKRAGCNVAFVGDEENRIGDGPGTRCLYHPGAPIFHEGSKGYLCCKRRVLEFEEFLKIEGCAEGRHLFVRKSKGDQAEQVVNCRIDHYQTPSTVYVTAFAKQADKARSVVRIGENEIHFDLYLPGSKRFTRSVQLFGPVDPSASSFKIFGTKVEVQLKKRDGRSWTLLEKTDRDLGPVSFTFGVTGRTGTVGAKEFVLDEQNSRNHAT